MFRFVLLPQFRFVFRCRTRGGQLGGQLGHQRVGPSEQLAAGRLLLTMLFLKICVFPLQLGERGARLVQFIVQLADRLQRVRHFRRGPRSIVVTGRLDPAHLCGQLADVLWRNRHFRLCFLFLLHGRVCGRRTLTARMADDAAGDRGDCHRKPAQCSRSAEEDNHADEGQDAGDHRGEQPAGDPAEKCRDGVAPDRPIRSDQAIDAGDDGDQRRRAARRKQRPPQGAAPARGFVFRHVTRPSRSLSLLRGGEFSVADFRPPRRNGIFSSVER